MRFIYWLIAILVVSTVTFAQRTTDPAQDPTALGNAFFKAMLNEDGAALSQLLASDCQITTFTGPTVDGDLLIQDVKDGGLIVETSEMTDVETRQYNGDSAVMTGNWEAKGSEQGRAFDTNSYFSVMSIKTDNAWKIVNVQFTPIQQ